MRPRTTQEKILVALSGFGTASILPFGIYRLIRSEWMIGIADITIAVVMALIGMSVLLTRKVEVASLTLAIISICSALASIAIKGETQVYWIYPAILACYYLLTPLKALIVSLIATLLSILLLLQLEDTLAFAAIVTTQVITNLFAYAFSKNMYDNQRALTNQARADSLTETGNRRALDIRLDEIVSVQARSPSTICLIILDIDHFKLINDEHGHRVGDDILIELTERLKQRLRVTDSLYRFGGEEFVIVPLPLDVNKAMNLAEELRLLVEQSPFNTSIQVTISLGIAQYKKNESYHEWLERADKALYQAKSLGRNRSCKAT